MIHPTGTKHEPLPTLPGILVLDPSPASPSTKSPSALNQSNSPMTVRSGGGSGCYRLGWALRTSWPGPGGPRSRWEGLPPSSTPGSPGVTLRVHDTSLPALCRGSPEFQRRAQHSWSGLRTCGCFAVSGGRRLKPTQSPRPRRTAQMCDWNGKQTKKCNIIAVTRP